ncbi:MAG: RNA-binding protein [Planctomycetaceae bacterium]|nr:RNA-binding protein [Planctomycetaceae bacterium]
MIFVDGRRKTVMKIYVGNLSYRMTDDELRQLFEEFGSVSQVDIISDRETGRSKGFAFVEMLNDEEANAAISALDGQSVGDRVLKINEARPKTPRPGGGGFGGGGGDRGGRPPRNYGGGGGDRGGYRDRERY